MRRILLKALSKCYLTFSSLSVNGEGRMKFMERSNPFSAKLLFAIAFAVMLVAMPHFALASAPMQVEEHPANLRYIFAAFLAVWAGFFLYAVFMTWRERKLRRDVEELKLQIQEKAKKA